MTSGPVDGSVAREFAPRVLLPEDDRHVSDLPDPSSLPERALASCPRCHTWWWRDENYVGFGFSPVWSQVYWFHWRLRARIKRAGKR
jgi:hypothetical protein